MISFKDLYKEDLLKKAKKSQQAKVSTKKPKKIEKLMEITDELLTPYWFWPHYIDNNLVPKSLAESLIKGSDPGLSPLSHSSKLSIVDTSSGSTVSITNRKAFSPCAGPPILVDESPDNTFYDIMLITRQRRSRVSENAFNIDEYLGRKPRNECESPLDMFRRFNPTVPEDNKKQTVTTKPKTLPSSPLDMNPYLESMLNMHDFEMIWNRKGDNLEISRAEGLMKLLGRALSPAEILLESVKNLWHDDLEIQIESKFFLVDRYIFTYYATNFRDMRGSFLQFPVCKIGMEMVMELYDWMVTDNKTIDINGKLISFCKAAKFLGISSLEDQYWATFALSGDAGIWEQNAFHTYLLARNEKCEDLMSLMMARIRKCFLPLVASREFLEFDANEVAFLLNQDTLCVNSEDEVFFAAVFWLDFAWKQRMIYTEFVMSSVRFAHLSPWLRLSLSNHQENQIIAKIAAYPKVISYLWEANNFCQARMYATQLQQSPTHISAIQALINQCKKYNITERFWVYCLGVPHHHDNRCCHYRELTYETFKLFLHRLQSRAQSFMDDLKFIPNRVTSNYICCYDKVMKPMAERTCPRPEWYTKRLTAAERT